MTATWSTAVDAAGTTRLAIAGDVDLADERPLVDAVEAILAANVEPVVLDLSDVDFLDSSGVRALVRLRLDHGDRVRLGAVSPSANRVLQVAGLLERLGGQEEPS